MSDVALLFLPLTLGVVGASSHAAAFWLASALMLAANVAVARLLSDGKSGGEPAAA